MKADQHRYSVSRGVRRLREAFAHKYSDGFGVTLDPETEVCVCMGTKDALVHTLMCTTKASGRALLLSPTYPVHRIAAQLANLEIDLVEVDTRPDRMLASIADRFAKHTYDILLLNFPNNPTGVSVTREFWAELLPLVKRNGCLVFNDFVYGELGLGPLQPASMLSVAGFKEVGVESYSLSKAYNVPGWRMGALVGAPEVVQRVTRLKAYVDYGSFLPFQAAAAAVLTAPENQVGGFVSQYALRARTLVNGLRDMGWKVQSPMAGASVWAELPQREPLDAYRWCEWLVQEKGVLALPGTQFGPMYERWIRFALVVSEETIRQVLEILAMASPRDEVAIDRLADPALVPPVAQL
jgi:alanine-synthesizing transaminase